ncbi:MAG TPA: hypothetical protein VFF91_03700 [Pseudoxanthomonas sp.]|nr:hypothetical protein [Pseudoxanthomonas sp.]
MRLRTPTWTALGLALVLAASAAGAAAQSGATRIEQEMTPAEFEAAGLDKLSPEELAALDAWLQRRGVLAPAASATAPVAAPAPAAAATAATLDAAAIERIREEAREEGRREVKEKSRGFFDFGSSEPIVSTLVGEFRGFARGRQYTLANGQVWEQVEEARLEGVRRTNPGVTIKPGLLNVWFLRVDGYNTAAKVRRVK